MCEFPQTNPNQFCVDRTCKQYDKSGRLKDPETCFTCEEKAITTFTYDGCGITSCVAGGPPCGGSDVCCFDKKGQPCTADICPYRPPVTDPCKRDDGTTCNTTGDMPECLMGEDTKPKQTDYLSKFKYKDFTKHTFNKKKYVPSSYLPGDGADFMYGYGLKPTNSETGDGPCGSPICPMASLDYILDKLSKPMSPLPTLLTKSNYCGAPICPYGPPTGQNGNIGGSNHPCCHYPPCPSPPPRGPPPCPYGFAPSKPLPPFGSSKPCGYTCVYPAPCDNIPPCDPFTPCGSPVPCSSPMPCMINDSRGSPSPCGAPTCIGGSQTSKKKQGCGAPDCKYAQSDPCTAPDCPGKGRMPCGAPDCKFLNHSEAEFKDPCPVKTRKKKKRQSEGDFDSMLSCDSGICPFADMRKISEVSCKVSCGNPECPFALKDDVCNDKTCPHAKELVVCQDCGGIILEDIDITAAQLGLLTVQEEKTDDKTNLTSHEVTNETKDLKKSSFTKQPDKPVISKDSKKTKNRKSSLGELGEGRKKRLKLEKKEALYTYPGVVIGHKTCMKRGKNVPGNMGWAWNKKPWIGDPELWRGYKPGAISKTVHRMIKEHRRAFGLYDPSEILRKKKSKISNKADKNKRCIEVEKKNGSYFVTVNPVKDPKHLAEYESPYMECTPMQFKIIKPEKPEKKPKPSLDDESGCLCDVEEEEESICSSSDNSELKFSFSPPAALPDLKPRRKKVKHEIETQYNVKDFNPDNGKKGKKGGKKGKKKK